MQRKPKRTTNPPGARDAALRLLSRREHSARELKRKLSARGVDETEASAAIAALASRDLQSDSRYAEQLIRTRIAQGHGPRRIEAELQLAGLARDDVQQALERADCDWGELAQRTLMKRFRGLADTPALRRKQQQFLYARGFESRQIARALDCESED
ncbi:MAG: regulatory protein RecX [Pseudomonadota bacterium]